MLLTLDVQIDKLHETHQGFEVLIGVAGRTGAGKSTILNMLLEIPELLPSSNSEAATACACRVSWNCEDAPDRKFRAEVTFRSYDDVEQEIQQILALLRQRQRLRERDMETDTDAFEQMEEEAEMEYGIDEGFKKIRAVWGLDEEAVEGMRAQDLLQSNQHVLQLLGTTHTIFSEDAGRFAEQVKPYLDSSETVQGFKAWPLITEVRLYVKAPFLKHGVVLVDLPGLSDSVESRARVAEKFTQKLEITAIVTPARRAIDEKTGVQLMSEYQTLRMQLDGKYHRKSFCVVVSQVDEIDCDIFIKGHGAAREDLDLVNDTKEIDSLAAQARVQGVTVREAEKELKRIEDKLNAAQNTLAALNITGPGSQKMKQRMYITLIRCVLTHSNAVLSHTETVPAQRNHTKTERTKQTETEGRSERNITNRTGHVSPLGTRSKI
jgi:hypothetical protein